MHQGRKVVHVVRHGATELHSYAALHRYGSPHQEPARADPGLFDVRLSREGQRQAMALAHRLATSLTPRPQIVLTSPLTRCMQTTHALVHILQQQGHLVPPVHVEALLRERLTLSSDIGRHPSELAAEFPTFVFPDGMAHEWWHPQPQPGALPVVQEPQDLYQTRLLQLTELLARRPEDCIFVVAHWGVLKHLCGRELGLADHATVHDWNALDVTRQAA